MQASTAIFQFFAEFVTFLAGAAGVALVLVRAPLMARTAAAKGSLALGFAALASAAFLHGSQVVVDGDDPVVIGLRAAGVVLVGLGTIWWAGSALPRRLCWLGLALITASIPIERAEEGTLANLVLALGSMAMGAALLSASRRSIAARVAASSAGTLLVVVLVLSVALSSVLTSQIRDEQLLRLDTQARTEVDEIGEAKGREIVSDIRIASESLANERAELLNQILDNPAPSTRIATDLKSVSERFLSGLPMAYVTPVGNVIASHKLDTATVVQLSQSRVVEEVGAGGEEATSVDVVGRKLLSVAARRVFAPPSPLPGGRQVGIIIGVEEFSTAYLEAQAFSDPEGLALTLADRSGPLASYRDPPADEDVVRLATEVLDSGDARSAVTDSAFVVAQPILTPDNRPIAVLLASKPLTVVDDARDDLFRTLFLIALGGTLIALVLAAFVGDRIGVGVRRLTEAAEVIQQGGLGVRANIHSDDEVGVLGAAFDSMVASIEEKTDLETRLRSRLEGVVAGMGEALVAVDGDGRITDFNQAAEELVGVTNDRVVGELADDVIDLVSDDGQPLGDALRHPPPGRASLSGWVNRADRVRIPVSVSSGALRGPANQRAGSVFVIRDLRREREVERMKTEFLSRVGHELRTPLTVIHGYADLLSRARMEPTNAQAAYGEILEQSRRLQRIVEMLEFNAASAAGRVYLRPEPVDLRTIVADAVAKRAGEVDKRIKLSKKVGRGVTRVMADRRWLVLALDELIDNAIKFSPNGGRIVVAAEVVDDGDRIELSVTDQGVGMTTEEQSQAFGDFVQGDPSDTRRFGGLGLGLALVRDVAEAHGGSVVCLSEPQKGSKFSVFLPVVPIERRR